MKIENKIGTYNFFRNLHNFQDIEGNERIPPQTRLIHPKNKIIAVFEKINNHWLLFVGVVFLFFTVKTMAESVARLLK